MCQACKLPYSRRHLQSGKLRTTQYWRQIMRADLDYMCHRKSSLGIHAPACQASIPSAPASVIHTPLGHSSNVTTPFRYCTR